jgi:hypothetical protein
LDNSGLTFVITKTNVMKKNMGNTDRIVRILVALVIGILYLTHTITGTLGIIGLAAGAIFLLTSFISFCPIYSIFGMSSCKSPKNA